MLYIAKGTNMRIDSAMPQPPQKINDMAAHAKEVAGEREYDGDADDRVQKVAAKAPQTEQIKPQGVGNEVDFFA
jgi:hypothetical protein